jgi:hypothetical protein
VPQIDGLGVEVMELCMPQVTAGELTGYLVATYSLQDILTEMMAKQLTRSQEVSFTEADGTRLALHGVARRGSRIFTAQQLVDLPGNTLVLRIDSWRGAPDLFPERAHGAGHRHVDRAGVGAGAAGQGHAPAPARRAATWPRRWRFARRWRTRWSPACARATCRGASPT